MSTSSIRAGSAFWEIFAVDKTDKVLQALSGKLKSFGTKVGMIGASLSAAAGVGLGGLASAVKSFTDFGGGIMDSMVKTSMGSDMLQTLSFMAGQAGGSIKDVETAAAKMNKTIGAAANGNKGAAQTLADLALTTEDLLELTPDERFAAIPQSLSQIADPALRAEAAMRIFGKSAMSLNEIIAGGSDGIGAAMQELKGAGLILSDKDITNADALGDSWGKLTATLQRAWQLIGASLAPALITVVEQIQGWASWASNLANKNRELIAALAKGVVVVGAIGAAMMGLSAVIIPIGIAIGSIVPVLGMIGAGFVALFNPVTLIVGALGAAVGALFYFSESARGAAKSAWDSIVSYFTPMIGFVRQVVGAMGTALSNGDLGAAGAIAMAALAVAFEAGKLKILDIWLDVKEFFLSTWDQIQVQIAGGVAFVSSLVGSMGDVLWHHLGPTFEKMAGWWDPFVDAAKWAADAIMTITYPIRAVMEAIGGAMAQAVQKATQSAPGVAKNLAGKYDAFLKETNGVSPTEALQKAMDARNKALAGASIGADERRLAREGEAAKAYVDQVNKVNEATAALAELTSAQQALAAVKNEEQNNLSNRIKNAFGEVGGPGQGPMESVLRSEMKGVSQGAFLGSAASMLTRNDPQVGIIEEQKKTNELLQRVVENTDDMPGEPVFAE